MNVATIEMPRHKARAKYAQYLRAVKQRHSREYEALKNGYRELSRGHQVLDLAAVMKAAGVDEAGRPRLAIIRADMKLCWFERHFAQDGNHGGRFTPDRWLRDGSRLAVRLPAGTFPGATKDHLRAVVPTIPPDLQPAGRLDRYHILWEAEWETIPIDPMLLRTLGCGLYVVLATWDLTELEQAVLRGTLGS